jgi:hypothetical protein
MFKLIYTIVIIRAYNMIKELAKRFEISLLTSLPDKVTYRVPIHFPSLYKADHRVRVSDQVYNIEELVTFP